MALLDTHSIVEELITVGFDKKQAEAITKINVATHDKLATKYDLEIVEKSLRSEIQSVRSEISTLKWMTGLGMAIILMMLSFMLSKGF